MSALIRIKQLVIARRVIFTEKADTEMTRDHLTRELVYESIVNAPAIFKTIRSRNPVSGSPERLHVILSPTYDGLYIYTKGKIQQEQGEDTLYILISSKRNIENSN